MLAPPISATRAATGAILAGSLAALVAGRVARARGRGRIALRPRTSHHEGAAAPLPLDGGAVHGRLGADDRRDDAADRASRSWSSSAALVAAAAARRDARRPRCSPAISWCGPRSGSRAWVARPRGPRRGRRASRGSASTRSSSWRATLAVAGLWQFSPLRDRCLDECRSPLGFVVNRWRGTSPSGARRSRWASPTARSASAAAGR